MFIWATWSLCWCTLVLVTECLPSGSDKYGKQVPSDDALNFMKKYGYLVDDHGQSEAIYSEESFGNIIRQMQRFMGIEETGIIDNSTLQMMSSPRCGVPDIIRNPNGRRKRFATTESWNKRHLTYYISNWSPKLGEATVARNVQEALDIWAGYGRLTFTRSSDPSADIVISFGSGYHGDIQPFDGPGNVLAHAFSPGDDMGGDIHFDNDENWVDMDSLGIEERETTRGTDFFTVVLHEAGHALGLSHSDVPTSVMSAYYRGWSESSQKVLDYDDIMGMYALYIQRRLESDYSYPSEEATTHPRPESTSTTRRTTTQQREDSGEITPSWSGHHHHHHHHHHDDTTNHPSMKPDEEDKTIQYAGDDESVERHKGHDPHRNIPHNNSPSLPDICHANFDAVATLRGELFIFKDQYVWRLKEQGVLLPGYPTTLHKMFPNLPQDITKIDAAYQRPDGNIALFVRNQMWIYDGAEFTQDSPLPLSYFGLPDYLDSIDAVQTWARNGKTYFYKNDRFWRYDETSKTMDPGYPMHMNRWRKVPENLDAATTWTDGVTYFFKGDLYWKFDNEWVKATDSSPLPIAPIWLGCKEEYEIMMLHYGS